MKTTSKTNKVLWAWNWTSGGYNSCLAASRKEALEEGNRMGAGVGVKLVVNEKTLVSGEEARVLRDRMDEYYRGMFD